MWKRALVVAVLVVLGSVALVWWLRHRGDHAAGGADAGAASADRAAILAEQRAARDAGATDHRPAAAGGRITRRDDGAGVAAAVVCLHPGELDAGRVVALGRGATVVIVADADGRWRAAAVRPGTYVVTAAAPGLVPGTITSVVLAAGADQPGLDLVLDRGGVTITGTITDVGGGPIADAQVRALRADDRPTRRDGGTYVAVSKPDGSYRLTLTEGSWDAVVRHADYAPGHRELELAAEPQVVDFQLTPGASIRGRVVRRDDRAPVPGAEVNAVGGQSSARQRYGAYDAVVADDAGEFVIDGLGSGAVALTARAGGYASPSPLMVALAIGEEVTGIDVVVDRAYTISGLVVKRGDARTAVAGVHLLAFDPRTGEHARTDRPSAADGTFEIVGVRPGPYQVSARGAGIVTELGRSVTVEHADVPDVLIEVAAGATLSGRIEPPAVARLSLRLGSEPMDGSGWDEAYRLSLVVATSEPDGRFDLRHAPAGDFVLVARARDGREGTLPVTIADADRTGLVVVLAAGGSIAGRVLAVSGEPVAAVRVVMRPAGPGPTWPWEDPSAAVTGRDGGFRFAGLPPGGVALSVEDERGTLSLQATGGRAPTAAGQLPRNEGEERLIVLAAGQALTGLVLTVETRDGMIRGLVVGADRRPLGDVWVTASMSPSDGQPDTASAAEPGGSDDDAEDDGIQRYVIRAHAPVLTDDGGRFAIADLQRGMYRLVAEGGKGALYGHRDGVRTGTTDAVITLAAMGSLAGTVTVAGGGPATDFYLWCARGTSFAAIPIHVLAPDGRYRIDQLVPGTYECRATSAQGTVSGEARVAGPTRLDLRIDAPGSLAGVAVDARTGLPLAGLVVTTEPSSAEVLELVADAAAPTTAAAGRFELTRLPPGPIRVTFSIRAGPETRDLGDRDYVVPPGRRLDLGKVPLVPLAPAPNGWLGLDGELQGDALVVVEVDADGPAAPAGVRVGDVIAAIDGRPIARLTPEVAEDLIDSAHLAGGQVVRLHLVRGAAAIDVVITAATMASP